MTESTSASWRRSAAGLLLAVTTAAASCDEPLRDVTGPSPNLQPTFTSVQSEIFATTDLAGRTSCITCHTDQGHPPAGNLNLTGDCYAALVNVTSRQKAGAVLIVPGDPDGSYLIQKLEGRSDINGLRMPRNGPPFLTDGQISVIRRWIAIGAPRD